MSLPWSGAFAEGVAAIDREILPWRIRLSVYRLAARLH
jgi:hypothetical protein